MWRGTLAQLAIFRSPPSSYLPRIRKELLVRCLTQSLSLGHSESWAVVENLKSLNFHLSQIRYQSELRNFVFSGALFGVLWHLWSVLAEAGSFSGSPLCSQMNGRLNHFVKPFPGSARRQCSEIKIVGIPGRTTAGERGSYLRYFRTGPIENDFSRPSLYISWPNPLPKVSSFFFRGGWRWRGGGAEK